MEPLSDDTRRILEFEAAHRRHDGAKEAAIHEVFGITVPRYYARLNSATKDPAALAEYPQLVYALRRQRERAAAARAGRRFV